MAVTIFHVKFEDEEKLMQAAAGCLAYTTAQAINSDALNVSACCCGIILFKHFCSPLMPCDSLGGQADSNDNSQSNSLKVVTVRIWAYRVLQLRFSPYNQRFCSQ
jgi:hypothetical protein